MIIALEGLPCSYKTSVVDDFTGLLPKVNAVEEFVLKGSLPVTPELCIVNDIAKSGIARILNINNHLTLMDRSYISTIVYEKTASTKRGMRASEKYQSLLQQGLLTQPDVVIFLDIEPETCIRRAKDIGRYDPRYEWFRDPMNARKTYLHTLGLLSTNPVITIPVENIDRDSAVSMVKEKILNIWQGSYHG